MIMTTRTKQALLVLAGLACWGIACLPYAEPVRIELVGLGAWLIGVVKAGPGHTTEAKS